MAAVAVAVVVEVALAVAMVEVPVEAVDLGALLRTRKPKFATGGNKEIAGLEIAATLPTAIMS